MVISDEKEFKRLQFTKELKQLLKRKTKSKLLTKERYDQLVEELLLAQDSDENNNGSTNDKELAKLLKNYQVVQIHGENRLIQPPNGTSPMKRYVHADELFDILDKIHQELDHCSKAKMIEHLKNVFADITVESVNLFYQMCDVCRAKADRHRGMAKKPSVSHPKSLMKWHLTIVDMTTKPDGGYQYILHNQDVDTKFCALRPLKDYEPKTVARELRHIFAWIGAPHVMSSNLRKKYVTDVVKCLQETYTNLVILPVKHTTEFEADDLENCLEELCKDYHSKSWSVMLDDLQFALNTVVPEKGTGITPFEAFLGREPQFGWNMDLFPQALRSKDLSVEKLKQYQQGYSSNNSSGRSSMEKTPAFSESEEEDDGDLDDSLNSIIEAEVSSSKAGDSDENEDEDSGKEFEVTKLVPPTAEKASTPKIKSEKKRLQKNNTRTDSKSVSFA